MSLRQRLALTVIVTAVALIAFLALLRADLEQRSLDRALRDFVVYRMQAGGRELCEDAPDAFGGLVLRPFGRRGPARRFRRAPPRDFGRGPRRESRGRGGPRPTEFWAYDTSFASRNTAAPAFPAELRSELESGAEYASLRFTKDSRDWIALGTRMTWDDGPCAVMLARRPRQRPRLAFWSLHWSSFVLSAAILCAVLFAAGPLVRRIRLLTEEVRRSARERYAMPVTVRGRDEIAGLASAFNEAGAELRSHLRSLEEREDTLRRFLGDTTHDLMLPLTVLQGHLATLRLRSEEGGRPDARALGSALEQAQYLGALVHNLGAAAKLDAGEPLVRSDAVELNALVERVVERHRPVASVRGIAVEFSVPEETVVIAGDVTLLEQAVGNVVHNSVRYNERGGHVAVLLERLGEAFSLRVLDDGPGIPDEDLARLPERSYRGEAARSREAGGLGLGLDITRRVAERHALDLALRRSEFGGLEVELSGRASSSGGPQPPPRRVAS